MIKKNRKKHWQWCGNQQSCGTRFCLKSLQQCGENLCHSSSDSIFAGSLLLLDMDSEDPLYEIFVEVGHSSMSWSDDVIFAGSLLLLDVDPEGPSYEIPMEALVSRPATRPSAPSILSSKSFLSFNGVPLNQTKWVDCLQGASWLQDCSSSAEYG